MKTIPLVTVYSAFLVAAACAAQNVIIGQASRLESEGKFKQAATVLTDALASSSLDATHRQQLEFELDRLGRIRKDYPLTKDALFAELQKSIKNLTAAELDGWIAEGRFDSREIDGERRFMKSSVSNLFFRHGELNARRVPPKDTAAHDQAVWETCQAIKQAALAEKRPYVLPKRFRTTMTVTAKPGAAPDGEVVRAWLPIPRQYPFQTDFELRSATPTVSEINRHDSPIRAVYLEQPARPKKPTVFKIEYDYTIYGVAFGVNPEDVKPADVNDPALKPFLSEVPHVIFTPEIRALSERIAGQETNPARKAKKFYDWIAENIKYSYATEYSTIRNISDYCRTKGYGDCGQEALLFMTLCRFSGVPARWQSGWNTFPGAKSIHDWCEIYLSPYSWIPVDPYKGIWAVRYALTLSPEQKRAVRDFYFGGLDQYRMAANSDHNQPLSPPKKSMRSDDVDFQRGELEWGAQNIYFDQYSYELVVKEVKLNR